MAIYKYLLYNTMIFRLNIILLLSGCIVVVAIVMGMLCIRSFENIFITVGIIPLNLKFKFRSAAQILAVITDCCIIGKDKIYSGC